jgi:hypothetical protein
MKRTSAPGAERLTTRVSELVEATLAGRQDAVAATLDEIGVSGTGIDRRPGVSREMAVQIFRRDCWTCRYCGAKTVPIPVLMLLSSLYSERFPHYPDWREGQVHPAYLLISTSLDHLRPDAQGDTWREPANLVTACWLCHTGKAGFTLEEVGWELLSEAEVASDWHGLTAAYPALWRLAGEVDPDYHRRWLDALGLGAAAERTA